MDRYDRSMHRLCNAMVHSNKLKQQLASMHLSILYPGPGTGTGTGTAHFFIDHVHHHQLPLLLLNHMPLLASRPAGIVLFSSSSHDIMHGCCSLLVVAVAHLLEISQTTKYCMTNSSTPHIYIYQKIFPSYIFRSHTNLGEIN